METAVAAPAAEGFFVPQTAADPGQTVTVYTSAPAQPAVATEPAPQQTTTPEAAPAEAPADPNAPPAEVSNPDPFPPLSPDGKWVNVYKPNPNTGQREFYTRVANTPEALAQFAENQQLYIERILSGQQSAQTQQPQAPQPDPNVARRESFMKRAQEIAEAKFRAVDPEANVGPLAEVMAELREEIMAEIKGEQKAATQAQRINAEIASIQKADPRFNPSDPFVQEVRSHLAKESGIDPSPAMVYGHILYLEAQAKANGLMPQNGTAAPAPAPAPAKPAVQGSQPNAFTVPSGTTPQPSPSQWDSHPEVAAAVRTHEQHMRAAGAAVTPESIARVKNYAIQSLQNRGTSGFAPPSQR